MVNFPIEEKLERGNGSNIKNYIIQEDVPEIKNKNLKLDIDKVHENTQKKNQARITNTETLLDSKL